MIVMQARDRAREETNTQVILPFGRRSEVILRAEQQAHGSTRCRSPSPACAASCDPVRDELMATLRSHLARYAAEA